MTAALERGYCLRKLAVTSLRSTQYESELHRQFCHPEVGGHSCRLFETASRMSYGLKICISFHRASCSGKPVWHRAVEQLSRGVMLCNEFRLRRGDFDEMTLENFGSSFVILAAPAEEEGLIGRLLDQRMPKQEAAPS
jgi:hypothetical protein